RERPADGWHRPQLVVRNGHGERGSADGRHPLQNALPIRRWMAALEARPPEAPLVGDSCRQVFKPTDTATRKVPPYSGRGRHREMPFDEQAQSSAWRVVAPPRVLSPNCDHPADVRCARGKTRQETADAVTD